MVKSDVEPFRVLKKGDNVDATDAMMKCSRSALQDIQSIRRKKNIFIGEDEGVPYLKAQLGGYYEGGSAQTNACYLQGNLRTWSASSLFSKAERENNPKFDRKVSEIKFCKNLVKEFCNGKWTSTL